MTTPEEYAASRGRRAVDKSLAERPPQVRKQLSKKEQAALDSVSPERAPNGHAGKPPAIAYAGNEKKWDVVYASDLPEEFTAPAELLQGILTLEGLSMVYGASGSGKTFLMVDLACAVAQGARWMGRQTRPGLVIYLAAEAPGGVMRRVQAYQAHHGVRIPNLVIVKNPIDFFRGEADAMEVVKLVLRIEAERGQKAVLVIADTLARISGDAQENGSDMGLVIRHTDLCRSCIQAHFSLVHHAGKNESNGARGWSGVRAAADTEIEVTNGAGGHVAEVKKQRDLATQNDRIGFSLKSVTLGLTDFGAPATTCIVESAEAPAKETGQKLSANGGAILEFLRQKGSGITISGILEHFGDQFKKTTCYDQLTIMVSNGQVHRSLNMYAAATLSKDEQA